MLVLDSDVFLIDCRYQRDVRYAVNQRFLQTLAAGRTDRATTLFNILEICGVLTFNLSSNQLQAFYANFAAHYGVSVLIPQLPERAGERMIELLAGRTLSTILRRFAFGDALMILTAESHPGVSTVVTWNASHFAHRTRLEVLTPQEWLSRHLP